MDTPILVTGGTGTLGRLVVERLREADGTSASSAATAAGPTVDAGVEFVTADLTTGEGVEAAVDGRRDHRPLAGTQLGDDVKTRHLVEAASKAGARHLVYISVVGAERIPIQGRIDRTMFGYFGSKLAAEQVVSGSGIPWTTLRATQFEQTFLTVARAWPSCRSFPSRPASDSSRSTPARSRIAWSSWPSVSRPASSPRWAGRRCYTMGELIRIYLQATNKRRLVVSVPTMGGAAAALRAGANLTPDQAVGRTTWEDFVAEQLSLPGEMSPGPA